MITNPTCRRIAVAAVAMLALTLGCSREAEKPAPSAPGKPSPAASTAPISPVPVPAAAAPTTGAPDPAPPPAAPQLPKPWPPVKGEIYPDLDLIDQSGARFLLSTLKGRPILMEPVGMS